MKNLKLIFGLALAVIITVTLLWNLGLFVGDNSVTPQTQPANSVPSAQTNSSGSSDSFIHSIFESDDTNPVYAARPWNERMVEIILRLLLAVALSAILAFRPRKNVPLFQKSLFVSQTQILLSVVAAALMMIVGDNAARAFAIFAAASLVRFRTNIRDPKEITVLLISLALGLAAGVGRWELGVSLCLFALALLWFLEQNESTNVFRSMELTVKTLDTERTHEVLKKIFKRMKIETEVREINPPDEKKSVGAIVFYLKLRLDLTTDKLSDRILAADPDNIEKIQWSKTKGATDIYG